MSQREITLDELTKQWLEENAKKTITTVNTDNTDNNTDSNTDNNTDNNTNNTNNITNSIIKSDTETFRAKTDDDFALIALDAELKKYDGKSSKLDIKIPYLTTIKDMTQYTFISDLVLSDCSLKDIDFSILPPNLVMLNVSKNILMKIHCYNAPKSLLGIVAYKNRIASIDIESRSKILLLDVADNNLTGKLNLPQSIEELDMENAYISYEYPLTQLQNLKILNIRKTCINYVDTLGNSITHLDISNTTIKKISSLPLSLIVFVACSCKLDEIDIDKFPDTIKSLILYNNFLKNIPILPDNMDIIVLSDNILGASVKLPKNIKHIIDLRDNRYNTEENVEIEIYIKTYSPDCVLLLEKKDGDNNIRRILKIEKEFDHFRFDDYENNILYFNSDSDSDSLDNADWDNNSDNIGFFNVQMNNKKNLFERQQFEQQFERQQFRNYGMNTPVFRHNIMSNSPSSYMYPSIFTNNMISSNTESLVSKMTNDNHIPTRKNKIPSNVLYTIN